jgi:hypothetical protein
LGERKRKIAELLLLSRQAEKPAKDRKAALLEAMELEKATMANEIALQRERVAIMKARVDMGESSREDVRALAEETDKLNEIERNSLNRKRELVNRIITLNNEIERNTATTIKNAKAQEQAFNKAGGITNTKINTEFTATGQVQGLQLAVPSIQPHATAATEMQKVWIDATQNINASMQNMASGFGEAVGLMLSGTQGIEGIGILMGSTIADMAINVGKMAVGTGIAVLGIKSALASLNPAVAIAAGTALIALGYAAKSGLANIANGGGASAAVAGGSGGGGFHSPNLQNRPSAITLDIKVHGEMSAQRGALNAAFEYENKRLSLSR